MIRILICLFLVAIAAPAMADGDVSRLITPADEKRLDNFDQTMREALAEARKGGSPADIAILDDALKGEALNIVDNFDMSGNWKCRVIKAGGLVPLIVYPNFKCRITDDDVSYVLTKLTGSQLTGGRFYMESLTRLTYLGAGWVAGEKPLRYNETPEQNQVAFAERRGRNRIILMFPAPQYESKLDILVMER